MAVGGGIWRKCQVVFFSLNAQAIKNDSGLDTSDAALGIDLQNARHVFREVENNGGVTTLSRKRCASTACQQRSAVVAAYRDCSEDVFFIARNHYTDWNLPIVGAVSGIKSAAPRIETNLCTKMAAKSGFKCGRIKLRGLDRRWGYVWGHRVQAIFEDAGASAQGQKVSGSSTAETLWIIDLMGVLYPC
jgi:hypothetical protein